MHAHLRAADVDVRDARLQLGRHESELPEHALELHVALGAEPAAEQQAVARARPRDVCDAVALVLLGRLVGGGEALEDGPARRPAARVAQPQADRAVAPDGDGRRIGRRRPRKVGHAHDRELEALRGVDRHHRDGVLADPGRCVGLAHVARVAELHLVDEAGQVGPVVALVAARGAQQLADVAEAALAVGRRQAREVVVVVGHDALEQGGQPELAARAHEPVVELLEAHDQCSVALGQALQLAELDRPVERALGGGAQRRQTVVGDADERRGEHDEQGMVVEAVAQEREIGAQVAHLLGAVEAAADLAQRRQARALERRGVGGGVARGAQQDGDIARARLTRVDELTQSARQRSRLDLPRGPGPQALGGRDQMKLGRRLGERRIRAQRMRRLEIALVEALPEDVPDDGQQLGS